MSELLNKLGYLLVDADQVHQRAKALFREVQRQEDQRAERLRRGTEVLASKPKHPLADAQPWDPVWVRAYSWGPWFLRLFSRLIETPEGLRIETFEHSARGEHCLVWVEGKPWVKGAKP